MEDERFLLFANLLNGNDLEQVARKFNKSTQEVDRVFRFIIAKIKSYRFERKRPYIACSSLNDARRHRRELLHILPFLNLDKEPRFKIIDLPNLNPNQLTTALLTKGKL